jgi:hypothetical protein
VLWGIQYIVCMCIIIDTILILEMIVWVPRVYLGVGSDNSPYDGREWQYMRIYEEEAMIWTLN